MWCSKTCRVLNDQDSQRPPALPACSKRNSRRLSCHTSLMAGHLRYSYPQTEAPRRAHGGGYEPAVRLWGLLRAPVALLLSLIGRRERNPNGFLHSRIRRREA